MANEVDEKTFAEHLRRAQDAGLTAADFSAEFDVSLSSVWRWLEGKNYPQPAMQSLVVAWIEAAIRTEKNKREGGRG